MTLFRCSRSLLTARLSTARLPTVRLSSDLLSTARLSTVRLLTTRAYEAQERMRQYSNIITNGSQQPAVIPRQTSAPLSSDQVCVLKTTTRPLSVTTVGRATRYSASQGPFFFIAMTDYYDQCIFPYSTSTSTSLSRILYRCECCFWGSLWYPLPPCPHLHAF